MRPDTSQTEIELTSSLLFPLPSSLGPELGRELGRDLGRKLGTSKQRKETSKLRMTRDQGHAISARVKSRVLMQHIKEIFAAIYHFFGVFLFEKGSEKARNKKMDLRHRFPPQPNWFSLQHLVTLICYLVQLLC